MRTLFFLLCTFPLFCLAQSPSNSTAVLQHQQALQQLQQQVPKAEVVDLETLAKQQKQEPVSCSSCAKNKAAKSSKNSTLAALASKSDLLAEQTRLANIIQDLRQATPVDAGLLQKYRRALELNVAEMRAVEAAELRQAKATASKH